MSQPRDDRQDDVFRPPLNEIINLRHPLVRLAGEIDWDFLAERFSSVCGVGPGQPPLPTRLVAGLFILKHTQNLSDEALCDRWVENPYFQYFCGEVVFRHELPFDRSSLEQIAARLQESLSVARRSGAIATEDLERVAVDTAVQEKAVAHPTEQPSGPVQGLDHRPGPACHQGHSSRDAPSRRHRTRHWPPEGR
jgi:transposase, IS5 family